MSPHLPSSFAVEGNRNAYCSNGKETPCQCRRHKRLKLDPWVRKIPWSKKWQPTLVFLPGEPHEQRSLAGYGPWSHKESDTTEAT